jgi:hypothetical protein
MTNYTNQSVKNNTIFNENEISEIEKQIINNPHIINQENYITKYFFYKIPNYLKY